MLAEPEFGFGLVLQQRKPFLLPARDDLGRGRDPGQYRPTQEFERVPEVPGRLTMAVTGQQFASPRREAGEPAGVGVLRPRVELIRRSPGQDRLFAPWRAQGAAQARDEPLDLDFRRDRRRFAPQLVDDPVRRHRAARLDQQEREHPARLWRTEWQVRALPLGRGFTEQAIEIETLSFTDFSPSKSRHPSRESQKYPGSASGIRRNTSLSRRWQTCKFSTKSPGRCRRSRRTTTASSPACSGWSRCRCCSTSGRRRSVGCARTTSGR